MKFLSRSMLITVLLVTVLALVGISTVQAGSPYFARYVPLAPASATCTASGSSIVTSAIIDTILEISSPPQGGVVIAETLVNGNTISQFHFALSGTFSLPILLDISNVVDGPYPMTYEDRILTVIDGQPVYLNTISFTCTADGTFPISITSSDLTSGSGSAINDGRLNPQNYAPVALYCDGSVLNAYQIDATGGTFVWAVDLSEAPTGNPIHVELDVALSETADGRFSVLAPQSDGKQYLFVFGGCPSPGTTETYVSDPLSGEFIRTG